MQKNKHEFTIKEALRNFGREVSGNVQNATVSVLKPILHAPLMKWGSNKYAKPVYARFRAVVYYKKATFPSKYPSWDYTKTYHDKIMYKVHSENEGYEKLIRMAKKIPKDAYNRIDIYANLTEDLRVETRNYNDIVCKIKDGNIIELCMLLRFREDGKLDARQTRKDTAFAIGENLLLKK